jgi:hypothetical protein
MDMASGRQRWLIVIVGIGLFVSAVTIAAYTSWGEWLGHQTETETIVVTVLQPGARPPERPHTASGETKSWRTSFWLDGSLFKPHSSVDLTIEVESKSPDMRPEKMEVDASLGAARKASHTFRLDGSDPSVVRQAVGRYRIRWKDVFKSDFTGSKPEWLPLGSYGFGVKITVGEEVVFDDVEVTQVSVRHLLP